MNNYIITTIIICQTLCSGNLAFAQSNDINGNTGLQMPDKVNSTTNSNFNNSSINTINNVTTKHRIANFFNFFHRNHNAMVFPGNGGLPSRIMPTGNGNAMFFPGNGGLPARIMPTQQW